MTRSLITRMLHTACLAVALAVGMTTASAAEPAPIDIDMPLRQVSDHVYYVR
jgi:hypothetical protein